jgi:hypothetical protein
MKKNRLLLIVLVSFISFSFTGGGGGKEPKSGGGGGPTSCPTSTIPLVLFQGNLNPASVPGRTNFSLQPATANIFNGFQATSTNSLFNDLDKNYCFITITAVGCSSYGDGGTKTYLWDSTNDGNNFDSTMNIEVPSDKGYTISIDFHESCGPYYSGFAYKRAMWVHQQNYNPGATIISISPWMYNRVNNC